MEKLKKERSTCRTLFTRAFKSFEDSFRKDDKDDESINETFYWLKTKAEELFQVDDNFKQYLYSIEDESVLNNEVEQIEMYKYKWFSAKSKFEKLTHLSNKLDEDAKSMSTVLETAHQVKRKFKLPKIELKKYDGDVRNWLAFWGQFKKIDEDDTLDDDDKYQYLLQATVEGSSARQLVESFPPSGPNYRKAITMMKSRFARDDLLIEIHIRELLKLVLNKESVSLRPLYDQLMSQLQALETLNVTKEKYAAMLYPMVESTLPEDVLRAWERGRRSRLNEHDKEVDELTNLLNFVARQVNSEERIRMANSGFHTDDIGVSSSSCPTAACIVAGKSDTSKVISCIWCDKPTHTSSECVKVQNLTLEERKEQLKKKKTCFKCLKVGHNAFKCKNFVKCIVCSRSHHALMCPEIEKFKKDKSNSKSEPQNEVANTGHYKNEVTLLPTLLVRIRNGKQSVTARTLIDTGSQRSYIKKDLIKRLGLKEVGQESLGHILFGGTEIDQRPHSVYNIELESIHGDFQYKMRVLDQDKICGHLPKISGTNEAVQKLTRNNVTLSDNGDCPMEISLLIGSDHYGALITGQFINLDQNLVAVKMKLGWTIQGQTEGKADPTTVSTNFVSDIETFWRLETIGITDPADAVNQSKLEEDVMQEFRETVLVNQDGRYEVNLLWKDGRPQLLSNYSLVISRLHSVTKRLLFTGNFDEYNNVLNEWLNLGIIEKVVDSNVSGHYLPHHMVVKESSSTTRVRPVFDASARDPNGNSINSCLYKGVNLIERIPKLLTRFRRHAIGVVSDIKKAFLQISLNPKDRDYLRFVWWKDNRCTDMITYRHCRVVFGIACSPFLLSATILIHLENPPSQLSRTAKMLARSFYVDNCIVSFKTESEAKNFMVEANQLMEAGKFELRGWIIGPSRNNKETAVPVLGLLWNSENDTLCCNSVSLQEQELHKVTKRILLSYAQRIFDPIGFTCPSAIVPKILLQKAWALKLAWDEELPNDILISFRSWLKKINYLQDCHIPRRLTVGNIRECDLSIHVFCDASKDAYATCIFLRSVQKNGVVTLRLAGAKARVTPLRKITIPRSELMAALIGVRLYNEFKENLNIHHEAYFWTDSSVALTWIQKEVKWSVFVNNRVEEIRRSSKMDSWRHILGSINPADILTRGCNPKVMRYSRWWEGPEWLLQPASEWPRSEFTCDVANVEKEIRSNQICNVAIEDKEETFINRLCYFSKYNKIVRMLAWIIRFMHKCRDMTYEFNGDVTNQEYMEAESILLRIIQKSEKESSKVKKNKNYLHVFTDSYGFERVKTRLTYMEDEEDFKCPIFLSGKSVLVKRLVEAKHIELKHAGMQVLISSLRDRYWITSIRKLTQAVISDCKICKRYNSKPVQPKEASLPVDRIKNTKAFEVTGVDMAGPLILRSGEKCWVALFTCAVYRAVHLELCLALSTDCFIMALRRFIARRGRPDIIYSDNGTNFLGTSNKLKGIDWNKVSQFSAVKTIKWRFNPPSAPWWGGWWERLIRILKELLRKILGQSTVNYEELETILVDCEGIMNTRPLTYIADTSDNLKPLTPAYFLQGISNSETPDLDSIDHESLNKRMRYLMKLRSDFRSRFRSEYLASLVHRGKSKRDTLRVGDVVLVETEDKRYKWPLGVIQELYQGKDNTARVAKVKMADSVKIRPFQRLYPFEVQKFELNLVETKEPVVISEEPIMTVSDKKAKMGLLRTRSGRIIKAPQRLNLQK